MNTMLKNGLYKKLILQFVCPYYLGLLPKVHSTILSIQIADTTPVERTHLIEPLQNLAPGPNADIQFVSHNNINKENLFF